MSEESSGSEAAERRRRMGLAGVGLEFAGTVAGLALVGFWIDRHFDVSPWGTLTGSLVGLIGGTYNFIRDALAGRPSAGGRDRGGNERR